MNVGVYSSVELKVECCLLNFRCSTFNLCLGPSSSDPACSDVKFVHSPGNTSAEEGIHMSHVNPKRCSAAKFEEHRHWPCHCNGSNIQVVTEFGSASLSRGTSLGCSPSLIKEDCKTPPRSTKAMLPSDWPHLTV